MSTGGVPGSVPMPTAVPPGHAADAERSAV